jgi:glycosyltransferase involved in cell wall biosynthesis
VTRRILHVVGESKFGGGGIVIIDLARAARAAGYDVAVLTTDPTFQRKLEEERIEFVDLDVIRRPIRPLWDLLGLFRLWRYLRRAKPDLVHTHTSKGGFVGRIAARMAGIRAIIHTVHGFAFHEHSPFVERTVYGLLERLAAPAGDLIVTVSEHHLEVAHTLRLERRARLMAIPNGLDPHRVEPTRPRSDIRSGLQLDPEVVAVTVIGRLADQKGVDHLIEAVARLGEDSRSRIRVLLAGDGPSRDRLQQQVAVLAMGRYVEFLGFRDDVADLLSAADVFVLPSMREGLSISLLEAMAAGKPIIATSIGSIREVTGDGACAVLVPPGDTEALVGALEKLITEPDFRHDLGERAQRRFERSYTLERATNAYLTQYADLLGRSAV